LTLATVTTVDEAPIALSCGLTRWWLGPSSGRATFDPLAVPADDPLDDLVAALIAGLDCPDARPGPQTRHAQCMFGGRYIIVPATAAAELPLSGQHVCAAAWIRVLGVLRHAVEVIAAMVGRLATPRAAQASKRAIWPNAFAGRLADHQADFLALAT
jgi:hypothetical protein